MKQVFNFYLPFYFFVNCIFPLLMHKFYSQIKASKNHFPVYRYLIMHVKKISYYMYIVSLRLQNILGILKIWMQDFCVLNTLPIYIVCIYMCTPAKCSTLHQYRFNSLPTFCCITKCGLNSWQTQNSKHLIWFLLPKPPIWVKLYTCITYMVNPKIYTLFNFWSMEVLDLNLWSYILSTLVLNHFTWYNLFINPCIDNLNRTVLMFF